MMQMFYNTTHSSLGQRLQTITQQRKQTFWNSSAVFAIVFCIYVENDLYAFLRPNYMLFSL